MGDKHKKDNFPIAAMRHYRDACLLSENGRNSNAMCHYAFSAECFVKAFYEMISCNQKGSRLNHEVGDTYAELIELYSFVKMVDVRTNILLEKISLPRGLFDGHPTRRYWSDIEYAEENILETRIFVGHLMEELMFQVIDGRIIINDI